MKQSRPCQITGGIKFCLWAYLLCAQIALEDLGASRLRSLSTSTDIPLNILYQMGFLMCNARPKLIQCTNWAQSVHCCRVSVQTQANLCKVIFSMQTSSTTATRRKFLPLFVMLLARCSHSCDTDSLFPALCLPMHNEPVGRHSHPRTDSQH